MNEFWQVTNPGIRIDKIRKTITLDKFSGIRCGLIQGSIYQDIVGDCPYTRFQFDPIITSAVTLEFWINAKNTTVNQTLYAYNFNEFNFNTLVRFKINPSGLITLIIKDRTTHSFTIDTNVLFDFYQWTHFAVSFDANLATKVLKFYKNGILVFTSNVTGLDQYNFNTGEYQIIPIGESGVSIVGNFSEIRCWGVIRTEEEIFQEYNKFISANIYPISLAILIRCNKLDIVGGFTVVLNRGVSQAGGGGFGSNLLIYTSHQLLDLINHPPLIYGASFIPVLYSITLLSKFSFKYPIKIPVGVNFVLCVSWFDDNGIFQRRKFWSLSGVDIGPNPPVYAGEKISSIFKLEIWNVDGNSSVDLPDDLILNTSHITLPTTSLDITQIKDIVPDPTADTTLASNFPLINFPLVFNTVQQYS